MDFQRIQQERWKQVIAEYSEHTNNAHSYKYPVADDPTDQNVEIQDSGMRVREKSLYQDWLKGKWEIALDFGCGTGANFRCFDHSDHSSSLLVGIEPDLDRALAAQNQAKGLSYIEAVVTCADISLLESAPAGLFVDRILCSQVLGHIPTREVERVLRDFAVRLTAHGSCALTFPVVGESYAQEIPAADWMPERDFTHIIDFSYDPFEKNYRTPVSDEIFDQYAAQSPPNVLPVRCFWLPEFPQVRRRQLPIPVEFPPPTIAKAVSPYFEISEIFLYSLHKTKRHDEKTAIGDVFLVLHKK